jgi:hypothetical protein
MDSHERGMTADVTIGGPPPPTVTTGHGPDPGTRPVLLVGAVSTAAAIAWVVLAVTTHLLVPDRFRTLVVLAVVLLWSVPLLRWRSARNFLIVLVFAALDIYVIYPLVTASSFSPMGPRYPTAADALNVANASTEAAYGLAALVLTGLHALARSGSRARVVATPRAPLRGLAWVGGWAIVAVALYEFEAFFGVFWALLLPNLGLTGAAALSAAGGGYAAVSPSRLSRSATSLGTAFAGIAIGVIGSTLWHLRSASSPDRGYRASLSVVLVLSLYGVAAAAYAASACVVVWLERRDRRRINSFRPMPLDPKEPWFTANLPVIGDRSPAAPPVEPEAGTGRFALIGAITSALAVAAAAFAALTGQLLPDGFRPYILGAVALAGCLVVLRWRSPRHLVLTLLFLGVDVLVAFPLAMARPVFVPPVGPPDLLAESWQIALELSPIAFGLVAMILICVHALVRRRVTAARAPGSRSRLLWAGWIVVGWGVWAGWYTIFLHWNGSDLTITNLGPMLGVAFAATAGAYAAASGQIDRLPRVLGTAFVGLVVGAALWIAYFNARYGVTNANTMSDFGMSVTEWIALLNLTLFGLVAFICASAAGLVSWLHRQRD